MMKSHRLLPYLYATSWLGTLLLTLLACLLVFRQTEPLTPGVFAAAALCLLSGNLLPLAVYFLQLRRERVVLEAEAAEAELSVRHALARSEDVLNRLDEAEGSLSKTLLEARQLPKRIEDSFLVAEKKCREQKSSPDGKPANDAGADVVTEGEGGLHARMDLLFETMESLQESVDAAATQLALLQKQAGAPTAKKKRPSSGPPAKETASEPPQREPQKELFTVSQEPASDNGTEVFIHAMIGISNRLYLRGDGPYLSWEKGEVLAAVGIGEYRKTFSGLEEPIQLALLLNDEVWSAEGRFTIEPGRKTELHASFPRE
ncbi:MAG: hypothetical protein GVY10_05395 [Verrucomicrobia bacterium]|jgi:hypothetical protein|nr:hypothetical protein [Verrucomicrobiota bacterium]